MSRRLTRDDRLALVVRAQVATIRADRARERAALVERQVRPLTEATDRVMARPDSVAAVIRAAAGGAPLLVLTGRALGDLAAELGGMDPALRHLAGVAEGVGRPVGVTIETDPGASSTAFLSPRGWTQGRLAGWVAGHHEELEAALGPVAGVGAA